MATTTLKTKSQTTGTITIHKAEIVKDISSGESRLFASKKDLFLPTSRSQHLLKGEEESNENGMRRSNSSYCTNGWLSEKSVRNIQEKIDYESSEIRDLYNQLMESEKILQSNMNSTIENDIEMKKRKVRLLSTKWHQQTYLPLATKIAKEMNGDNYRRLDAEKRRQYTNYLNHRNNKEGHVFLDVYAEEEYDPLYLNAHRPGPLKAATGKLADPLLHLQDKHNDEERTVLACELGETLSDKEIEARRLPKLPLIPLGRHGTLCSTWLDMELTDIQSDVRLRSQVRRDGTPRNKSTFTFNEEGQDANIENLDGGTNVGMWQKKKQFPEKYDTNVELL